MNLIMTMIFMKIPLKFQVLLQQSCLVDGGLKLACAKAKSHGPVAEEVGQG